MGLARRPLILLAMAALLVVAGLASAISAPGAPPTSNKADAYGGPVQQKPTNPSSRALCDSYYGATNNLADAKDCRAIATRNAALKKCKKKTGLARARCQKAARKKFAKQKAAIAKQRAAEKACTEKHSQDLNALDIESPDYSEKATAADEAYNTCMKAALGS
jgi:hypothetical protein